MKLKTFKVLNNIGNPLGLGFSLQEFFFIGSVGVLITFLFLLLEVSFWWYAALFVFFLILIIWNSVLKSRGFGGIADYLNVGQGSISKDPINLLPLTQVLQKGVVLENGSFTVGFALSLPSFQTLDESGYEKIISSINNSISTLKVGTSIQMYNAFDYGFNSNNLLSAYTSEPKDFFKKKEEEFRNDFLKLTQKSYLFLNFKKEDVGSTKKVESTINSFVSGFSGISLDRMSGEKVAKAIFQHVNGDILNHQNSFNEISETNGMLKTGGRLVKVVSLVAVPSEINTTSLDEYGVIGELFSFLKNPIFSPHAVSHTIEVLDSKKQFQNTIASLNTLGVNSLSRIKVLGISEGLQGKEEILEAQKIVQSSAQKVVSSSFNVIFFGKDAEKNAQQAIGIFSKIGFSAVIESFSQKISFLSAAPSMMNLKSKKSKTLSLPALALNTYTSPPEGDKGGLSLINRFGQVVKFDCFSGQNYNQVVLGASGSGKSWLGCMMIKTAFEKGAVVIVIDSGGTYRRLFNALGGKFIEYEEEKPLGLNFFEGYVEGDNEKIEQIKNILIIMWKGSKGVSSIKNEEDTILSDLIESYFQKEINREKHTLEDFFDFVVDRKIDDKLLKIFNKTSLITCLRPYAKGRFAGHFKATRNKFLVDEKLICFEMERVQKNPKLYPIVSQMLFDLAFQIVSKKPKAKKYIFVEEGWAVLNSFSEENISFFFRKGRKTNTSITFITQSIEELLNSKVEGAIKNNADTLWLLKSDSLSQREEISNWWGLKKHSRNLFSSLGEAGGERPFREVLAVRGGNPQVLRAQSSFFAASIFTSNPFERALMDRYLKKNDDNLIAAAINFNEFKYKQVHG